LVTQFFQEEGPDIDVPMGHHGSKKLHVYAHVEEYESKYPKIAAEMKKGECSLLYEVVVCFSVYLGHVEIC